MTNDDFEWDDAKAAANFAKHGVTFEGACEAFNDPFALNWEDDGRHAGEQRFVTFGMAGKPTRVCCVRHERRENPDYFGAPARAL
jgi:uncharacterized DUF497 family protein